VWCTKNRLIVIDSESSTSSVESDKGPISKGMGKGCSKVAAKAGPSASTGTKRKVVEVQESPMVKWPQLESTHSNLPEELDRLGAQVDSAWDEVIGREKQFAWRRTT